MVCIWVATHKVYQACLLNSIRIQLLRLFSLSCTLTTTKFKWNENLLLVLSNHNAIWLFSACTECLSEAVKLLKADYLVKAINAHKMDQAIIFCRTKIDCDNIEDYLQSMGGGQDTPLGYYQYTTHVSWKCCQFVGPKSMVNEYSCVCLHGDRRPQERKANLQKFKVQIHQNYCEVHCVSPPPPPKTPQTPTYTHTHTHRREKWDF